MKRDSSKQNDGRSRGRVRGMGLFHGFIGLLVLLSFLSPRGRMAICRDGVVLNRIIFVRKDDCLN